LSDLKYRRLTDVRGWLGCVLLDNGGKNSYSRQSHAVFLLSL